MLRRDISLPNIGNLPQEDAWVSMDYTYEARSVTARQKDTEGYRLSFGEYALMSVELSEAKKEMKNAAGEQGQDDEQDIDCDGTFPNTLSPPSRPVKTIRQSQPAQLHIQLSIPKPLPLPRVGASRQRTKSSPEALSLTSPPIA